MRGRRVSPLLALLLLVPVLAPPVSASVPPRGTEGETRGGSAPEVRGGSAPEVRALRGERRCPDPPSVPGRRTTGGCGRVLVVGAPGLRWSDVGPGTPMLLRLAEGGAVGVLSVKAVPAVTCRADGWLTLGAGGRAVAEGVERDPCGTDLPTDLPAALPGDLPTDLPPDQADLQAAQPEREATELGALAAALDGCVDVVGAGPLLATPSGPPDDPAGCGLVLRELPAVGGEGTARAAAALAADRALGDLLVQTRVEQLLVVGLSAGPGEDGPALHVALGSGRAFPPGALVSASTRRAPYVQLVDVAPTVLELLEQPVPDAMTGQPWRSQGAQPDVEELVDVARLAQAQRDVTVPFFLALLALELGLLLLLVRLRRLDLAELVALGGVAAMGASYVANLVPWWRSPAPLLTLLGVVVAVSAAVATLATSRPVAVIFAQGGVRPRVAPPQGEERSTGGGLLLPVGIAAAFTAGVLLLDLATGAHLQMSSVAGYSPLVAGRFAGIGNVAFGVLAAALLLALAALTRRTAVVAAVGAVAVVLDGAPPFGSDVGGVLALVPALALLAMLLAGRRVSVTRLLGAGLAGAAVVAAFALLDLTRAEADRTHLGRFAADVLDGSAGTLLRRKADAVLGLLFSSPVTALLPVVVAAAGFLVVRPPAPLRAVFDRAPAWRAGVLAVGLASAVGFAVNDSGAAVPALALAVAIPATVAVVLRDRAARPAPEDAAALLA